MSYRAHINITMELFKSKELTTKQMEEYGKQLKDKLSRTFGYYAEDADDKLAKLESLGILELITDDWEIGVVKEFMFQNCTKETFEKAYAVVEDKADSWEGELTTKVVKEWEDLFNDEELSKVMWIHDWITLERY